MPLYISTTQEGTLTEETRDHIANEITRIHTAATGVPRNWVHILFLTYAPGSAYNGDAPGRASSLVGLIRVGHTAADKAKMLGELWPMYQRATGLAETDLVLVFQETTASNAMELGKILPDPGQESDT